MLGSRDGCCCRCCYLVRHSEVSRGQLPSRTPGRRQAMWAHQPKVPLQPQNLAPARTAPPQGDLHFPYQEALWAVGVGGGGQANARKGNRACLHWRQGPPHCPQEGTAGWGRGQEEGWEGRRVYLSIPDEGVWMSCDEKFFLRQPHYANVSSKYPVPDVVLGGLCAPPHFILTTL